MVSGLCLVAVVIIISLLIVRKEKLNSENLEKESIIKDAQIEEAKRMIKKLEERCWEQEKQNVINVTGTNKVQFNLGKMIESMCGKLKVTDKDLYLYINLKVLYIDENEKAQEKSTNISIPISYDVRLNRAIKN